MQSILFVKCLSTLRDTCPNRLCQVLKEILQTNDLLEKDKAILTEESQEVQVLELQE